MKFEDINIRDPFVLPYDGKYYMYGSRGHTVESNYGKEIQVGFDVYVSKDLENWDGPKSVFEITADFWATKDAWAPEVHVYNGRLYMFASFKADGKCRGTQILVADTPDGIFVPLSDTPVTPADWECLDGTLYVDQKGEPHIVFCHEWVQIGDGTVCEMQLSRDLTKAVTAPRELWKASDYPLVHTIIKGKDAFVTDGPFMLRNDNGDLICIWSSFNENGYAELISKSDNGEIDGNWSVLEQPLSSKDGGHGMVFESFSGERFCIMHKPNQSPLERPVLFQLQSKDGNLFI